MNISLRAQRVYAGIAVMDEKNGEGWVFKVDPNYLDMASTCNCVIGQMYSKEWPYEDFSNPFDYGAWSLDLDTGDRATRHGFDADVSLDDDCGIEFTAPTRIWAFAIRRLREIRGGAE